MRKTIGCLIALLGFFAGCGILQNRFAAFAAQSRPPKPGVISGIVLNAETGRPLAKATVTLMLERRSNEGYSVRTDVRGQFLFPEVLPGRYRLRAQRNGFVTQIYGARRGGPGLTITLAPGQVIGEIEFRLDPAGIISGRVTDEELDPLDEIEVRALRARFLPGGRLRVISARTARTDDLGDYRLFRLSPGTYFVQAGGRGEGVSIGGETSSFTYAATYYPRAETLDRAARVEVSSGVEARGIDIAVRLTPLFSITGLILDRSSPMPGRRYAVGFARGGSTATRNVDSEDGSFTLGGLEPGDYTLVATVSDANRPVRQGFRNVRIEDSDVSVTIEMGRNARVRGTVRMDDGRPFPFPRLRINLEAEQESGHNVTTAPDDSGNFLFQELPEGSYFLQLLGREDELYLKEARCRGEDYTARALEVAVDQPATDCTLVVSREVGLVSGRVMRDAEPASGFIVALIPVQMERRKIPRHNLAGQVDANGNFQIEGVVPGEYFAFAVPPMEDAGYYDLAFADRNNSLASRLTVRPREHHRLELKPIEPR